MEWPRVFLMCLLLESVLANSDGSCSETGYFDTPIGNCSCGWNQNGDAITRMNCTNLGIRVEALQQLPYKLRNLTFTGNNLAELPSRNIFGRKDNDIEFIDLSNNHITKIHGQTFHHVDQVHTLILDYNEWKLDDHNSTKGRVFSNFWNLRRLSLNQAFVENLNSTHNIIHVGSILRGSDLRYLEEFQLQFNYIQFVNMNTFCPLKSLRILHLANNVIFEGSGLINANCMSKLEELYLHNNSLSYLNQQEMDDLDTMVTGNLHLITLGNNSWRCACSAKPFIRWLQSGSGSSAVVDRHTLKCQPEEMGGTRLLDVDVDKIQCHAVDDLNRPNHRLHVAISFLFASVIIIGGLALWWKRAAVFKKVRRVKMRVPVIARWNSGPDYQGLVTNSAI